VTQPATPSGHAAWEDRIIAALDGRAPADALDELERHVAACEACRAARAEYGALFAGLRAAVADPRAGFWDELAASIEQRLDAEAPVTASAATGRARSAAGRLDAAGARGARRAVVGGVLAAACLAVAILTGLYLALPRGGASPQAFTSAPPETTTGLAAGPGPAGAGPAGAGLPATGDPDAAGGAPDSTAVEESLAQLASSADPREPLAVLADPDPLLESLTPEEAAELLDLLEDQT
jgi:hypothetical protein